MYNYIKKWSGYAAEEVKGTALYPFIFALFSLSLCLCKGLNCNYVFYLSLVPKDPIITEYGPEFSSTHLKPEHRVAYWREDYGINLHHWHWHLVFPLGMDVQRDRKGELFYYMHQQMLARLE